MTRVMFDVYELAPGSGKSIGIYNYAKCLFRELVAASPRNLNLIVAFNGSVTKDFAVGPEIDWVEYLEVGQHPPSKAERLTWFGFRAAIECRRHRADVYFSPKGFLPLGMKLLNEKTTTIVTIHDLIPLWYKEFYPRYFGRLEEWFICGALVRSAQKTDKLITISHASENDITCRTSTSTQIRVIYNGLQEALEHKCTSVGERYIFAMTSKLPHKNSKVLLDGYRLYRERTINPMKLIVCGIDDPCIYGVEAVNRITENDLQSYYAGAAVFVFLSLAEGFGFPPLEAMRCGTAVICSDIPVLREITREASIYISPTRPDLLAAELSKFTDGEHQNSELARAERRDVAKSYSWHNCAEQFLEFASN